MAIFPFVVFSGLVGKQHSLRTWEKLIAQFEAAIANAREQGKALRRFDQTRQARAAITATEAETQAGKRLLSAARRNLARQRATLKRK